MSRPRVVLDTTAIVGTGFGMSHSFGHLLKGAANGLVEVSVPEIAVKEAVFVYRRQLRNERLALKKLPRLVRAAGQSWSEIKRARLVEMMESRLRFDLESARVKILRSPQIDADEMVSRILERRKPTKELIIEDEGPEPPDQTEGFRDQMIWAHVRSVAMSGNVTFITDNTRDFAKGGSRADGQAELHSDLLEDLAKDRERSKTAGAVDLVLSVEDYVEEHLQDQVVLERAEALLNGDAGERLVAAIYRLVDGDDFSIGGFEPPVDLDGAVEEATLISLSQLGKPRLVDAFQGFDGLGADLAIQVDVEGEGDVLWLVSGPSGWDLDFFPSLAEGVEGGGGFISDTDLTQLQLVISGRYDSDKDEWADLEIDYLAQAETEQYARRKRNREKRMGLPRVWLTPDV